METSILNADDSSETNAAYHVLIAKRILPLVFRSWKTKTKIEELSKLARATSADTERKHVLLMSLVNQQDIIQTEINAISTKAGINGRLDGMNKRELINELRSLLEKLDPIVPKEEKDPNAEGGTGYVPQGYEPL
jgi:hypothetical protein